MVSKVAQFYIDGVTQQCYPEEPIRHRSSVQLIHTGSGQSCYGLRINSRPIVSLPMDDDDPGYQSGGNVYRQACRRAWRWLEQRR
jgi:hypothetical protein